MNVKHGFSTLNRLLGKKNKGHVSKSTTNLSLSSQYDNSSSLSSHHQLEQNRITPLSIAATNAPFEQTFRITVLLPKGQLYVARLGAKTKLQKLLEIVCENKQLDQEKYEFRHPVDSSQVFSYELTIGAVGLNEIRLCHKSETYDNFNSDEIIKLRHTGRDSLSSSELSSRNSKNTLKTHSPYSSTNSLNSIDSTGMSTSYRIQVASLPPMSNSLRSFVPQQSNVQQPPVAPARKKRAAPRPPSQNSIPEKEPVNGYSGSNAQESVQSIPRREFHVSSPNLMIPSAEFPALRLPDFHKSNLSVDCNGNVSNDHHFLKRNHSQSSTGSDGLQNINTKNQPISLTVINDEVSKNNTYNGSLNSIKVENRNDINFDVINCSTETLKVPEPVPRKKIIAGKKKAPAPPPRTLGGPVALPRNSTASNDQKTIDNSKQVNKCEKDKLNEGFSHETSKNIEEKFEKVDENHKEIRQEIKQEKLHTNTIENVEVLNKVTELDKREQIASSVPQSSVSDISQDYKKPSFESSSDEDENIKVYNLKLGKTIVKPFMEHKTYEDLSTLSSFSNEFMSDGENKSLEIDSETQTLINKIPTSPNSTDNLSVSSEKISIESDMKKMNLCKIDSDGSKNSSDISDSPMNIEKASTNIEQQNSVISENLKNHESLNNSKIIFTSNIENECSERNVKDNKIINKIENENKKNVKDKSENLSELVACEIKQNDVIAELNNVLSGNKLNTIISRSEDVEEIELQQTCALSNFKIQSYTSNYDPVRTVVDLSGNNKEFNTPSIEEHKTTKEKENNQSNSLESIVQQEQNLKNFSNQNENLTCQQNNDTIEKDYITCSEQDKTPVNQSLFEGNISSEFDNNDLKKKSNLKNKHEELSNQNVEEERLYKKNSNNGGGNINPQILKSRINITRSDSFHSTRYPNSPENSNKSGISLRSLSYVSLLNAQNYEHNMRISLNQSLTDTHRRKSSSELSIRESPNLQSLIIMKSILNSRQSSLSTEDDLQQNNLTLISKSYMNDYTDDTKITRISYDENDSLKENLPKNNKILDQENIKNDIQNIQKENKEEQYKKQEKRWTYQGPPSINLTSWNERPKIQVSIKNDGDYKFGIGGGGIGGTSTSITTFPRVYRNSLASTIPINYSTQSQKQIGSCNTQINPLKKIDQSKVPFVRNVEYKKPTTQIDLSASSQEINSVVHNNPNFESKESMITTMTLGRIPKMLNRTETFTPAVRNFKTSSIAENDYSSLKTKPFDKTSETVNDEDKNNSLHQKIDLKTPKSTNNLGRSNSVTTTYSTKYSTQNDKHKELYKNYNEHNNSDINEKGTDNSVENPFSKIVLRKTGLKEKIMSTSDEQQIIPSKPIKTDDQDYAKLELKLKTHTQKPKTLIKPTKQSPPPPPPPIIRSVVTKQQIGSGNFAVNNKYIPNSRDELLSAIRNFNKDILKRS